MADQTGAIWTGVEMIAEERSRHATKGFTPEHDAEHDKGELVRAAICYSVYYLRGAYRWGGSLWKDGFHEKVPPHSGHQSFAWPWHADWWRPNRDNLIRNLVKAGALIAAEIDRQLAKEEALSRG